MKLELIPRIALFSLLVASCSTHLSAQSEQQKLTATIFHLDSAFWNAYNSCDTLHFKDFMSDDVEFYHDKGGITIGAKALIESLNKNICGNSDQRIRREAVAGTVKVYPMHDGDKIYGAIISGDHKFYITPKGKPEFQSGIASFTELWQLKNGVWNMTRILSYNHHEPDYLNTRQEVELPSRLLDQLTGAYKSAQSGTMTVIRDSKLLLLKGDKNTFTLYPLSATSFFTKDRDLLFEFVKDAARRPLKLIVKEHGAVADELMFEK